MEEEYQGYTVVYYSGCCGSGGAGLRNLEGLDLLYQSEGGFDDLHLFPTDREAKEWIDGGARTDADLFWGEG